MKNAILFIILAILLVSGNALADTKVKIKQTVSGQTMENTTYIKGKRQRTEIMGGAMVSVTQCDLGRDLQMNPGTKTYTVTYYDDGSDTSSKPTASGASVPVTKGGTMTVTTTIKDTGERKQMFGFTARHIIQTIETETTPDACLPTKTKMEMDSWVIDVEFGIACRQTRYNSSNGGKPGGCRDRIVPKTIGTAKTGYPVWQKMTSYEADGKESFTMISEVVELSKSTLDPALFEAPVDFREVKSASEMYASRGTSGSTFNGSDRSSSSDNGSSSAMITGVRNAAAAPRNDSPITIGAKKEGTIRLGLAGVKAFVPR